MGNIRADELIKISLRAKDGILFIKINKREYINEKIKTKIIYDHSGNTLLLSS